MLLFRALRRFRERHPFALGPALVELLLVFLGVLAAFLASDYQEQRARAAAQREALAAVHADLVAYVRSGLSGDEAFVSFFQSSAQALAADLERQSLDALPGMYFGDHFKLELTHNLYETGRLDQLPLTTYRKLARFLVIHSNFLHEIERLNGYLIDHVHPALDGGAAAFFDEQGRLRRRFELLPQMVGNRGGFAEFTVRLAGQLIADIEQQLGIPAAELPELPAAR